jgi:hypothetical protein
MKILLGKRIQHAPRYIPIMCKAFNWKRTTSNEVTFINLIEQTLVEFEVLMAAVILWDIPPCSPLVIN